MGECAVMQHTELISQTLKCGKRTSEHATELPALSVLKNDQQDIVRITLEGVEQES